MLTQICYRHTVNAALRVYGLWERNPVLPCLMLLVGLCITVMNIVRYRSEQCVLETTC